jgi:hypothetical protein
MSTDTRSEAGLTAGASRLDVQSEKMAAVS